MPYNPQIPQASDLISDSQLDILTNFQELNLVYGDENPVADPNSDHYAYDDGSTNARKHRKVRLVPQVAGAGIPTPAVTEGVIYAQDAAGLGQTLPFYRKDAGTLDFPILPIRAIVRCTNASPPVITGTSFNVNTVTKAGSAFTITFDENLPDTNYLVFAFSINNAAGSPPFLSARNLAVDKFDVVFGSGTFQEICVVVMHYAV
jgi:hypothetical protein